MLPEIIENYDDYGINIIIESMGDNNLEKAYNIMCNIDKSVIVEKDYSSIRVGKSIKYYIERSHRLFTV